MGLGTSSGVTREAELHSGSAASMSPLTTSTASIAYGGSIECELVELGRSYLLCV